jgi:hypothetical protein
VGRGGAGGAVGASAANANAPAMESADDLDLCSALGDSAAVPLFEHFIVVGVPAVTAEEVLGKLNKQMEAQEAVSSKWLRKLGLSKMISSTDNSPVASAARRSSVGSALTPERPPPAPAPSIGLSPRGDDTSAAPRDSLWGSSLFSGGGGEDREGGEQSSRVGPADPSAAKGAGSGRWGKLFGSKADAEPPAPASTTGAGTGAGAGDEETEKTSFFGRKSTRRLTAPADMALSDMAPQALPEESIFEPNDVTANRTALPTDEEDRNEDTIAADATTATTTTATTTTATADAAITATAAADATSSAVADVTNDTDATADTTDATADTTDATANTTDATADTTDATADVTGESVDVKESIPQSLCGDDDSNTAKPHIASPSPAPASASASSPEPRGFMSRYHTLGYMCIYVDICVYMCIYVCCAVSANAMLCYASCHDASHPLLIVFFVSLFLPCLQIRLPQEIYGHGDRGRGGARPRRARRGGLAARRGDRRGDRRGGGVRPDGL